MHKNAEEYDNHILEQYYKENPPKDRPCNWCGQPVAEEGKDTHDKCLEFQRAHTLK